MRQIILIWQMMREIYIQLQEKNINIDGMEENGQTIQVVSRLIQIIQKKFSGSDINVVR